MTVDSTAARWSAPSTFATQTIGRAWLEVAARILERGRPSRYDGRLTFVVKSAHIYDTEAALMRGVLAQAAAG